MSEAWSRGSRDEPVRTPLHGGENQAQGENRGERQSRHILPGVSHPSDDPAQHRTFEVRASFDTASGGWVARAGEQNLNEQRGDWGPILPHGGLAKVFPSAAACLGGAVATIIAAVDRGAEEARCPR